jgi:hypothetical protein
MRRVVVRYKTKPDKTQENERLIDSVFEELRVKSPDGVRYLALRLADGSFLHFVASDGVGEDNPLREAGELPYLPERHQGALPGAAPGRGCRYRGRLSYARRMRHQQDSEAA